MLLFPTDELGLLHPSSWSEKHGADVAPGPIAVAATDTARQHWEALDQFCQEFPTALVTEIGATVDNAALVVVLCEGVAPPQSACFKTVATVGYDVPIVWGDPWRPFYQAAPRQAKTGITHEGMLQILSHYGYVVRPFRGAYCEFDTFDGRTFGLARTLWPAAPSPNWASRPSRWRTSMPTSMNPQRSRSSSWRQLSSKGRC